MLQHGYRIHDNNMLQNVKVLQIKKYKKGLPSTKYRVNSLIKEKVQ